jgi:hypothetical protein
MEIVEIGDYGFQLRNFPYTKEKIGSDFYPQISPHDKKEIAKICLNIKGKREIFLSHWINIENLLDQAISNYFFGHSPNKKEKFEDCVLSSTILTFHAKSEVLRQIMKDPQDFEFFTITQRSKNISTLRELIKWRNAFAHGKIIIDYERKEALLRYYNSEDHEVVEKPLTPKFFDELIKQFVHTKLFLNACAPQEQWSIMIEEI